MSQVGALAASASANLARLMALERDETILEAVSLVISQRPDLQQLLLDALQEPPPSRFVGTIKSFFEKYGFIECEETKQAFGSDVFLSDLEKGLLNVGDTVSFTVVLNKSGKPQARLLEKEPVGGAAGEAAVEAEVPAVVADDALTAMRGLKRPLSGGVEAPVTNKVARPPQSGWAASLPPIGWGPAEQRFSGVIKSFFPMKRYGFIACEETTQMFGADVFLSDMEIGQFSTGSKVSFTLTLNKDGKPQARQLEAFVESQAPARGAQAAQAVPAAGMPCSADGEWANVGLIKSFWPEKHYGFIQCDAIAATHGGDVFLAEQELNGFEVGCWVAFDTAYNKNGKPQARNLRFAPG